MAEFECELKPYCVDDCNNCLFAKRQAEIQRFNEAVEDLKKELISIVQPVYEIAIKLCERMTAILGAYHNKRAIHLALHHPKEKVRKKNIHRISKWVSRGLSDND